MIESFPNKFRLTDIISIFYLPASEKEVIEEKKPTGDTLSGSETVLFVDDDNMIIEVAEKLLDRLGSGVRM